MGELSSTLNKRGAPKVQKRQILIPSIHHKLTIGRKEGKMHKKSLTLLFILLVAASMPVFSTQFAKPVNVSKSRTRLDTLPAIAVDKNNKVHIAGMLSMRKQELLMALPAIFITRITFLETLSHP